MERALFLTAATWVGGVGAWGVGVGYALGAARARTWGAGVYNVQLNAADEGAPPPPTEVVDAASLPAPPLPLDDPSGTDDGSGLRSAAPSAESLAEMEEFLLRQEARVASQFDLASEDDDDDDIEESALLAARAKAMSERSFLADRDFELDVRPPDASALLTESQRRRLAPIKPLKRERRSRKIRVNKGDEGKFIPIVPGARATQDEAILNAFNADSIEEKREQGEDYWVDPKLLQEELDAKESALERRRQFKKRETVYSEDKLKKEITAPYKNNVIGYIVAAVGIAAVAFSQFPGLLDNQVPLSVATFPDTL